MSTVRVRPVRPLSSEFAWERDGAVLGRVEVARWGRVAGLTADGVDYDLVRVAALDWELRRRGLPDPVARAGRDRAMSSQHRIAWDDRVLRVRSRWWRVRLEENDVEVGWARPAHILTRSLVVELPSDLPGFVVGLVAWSVVRMRRAAAAASAGGA